MQEDQQRRHSTSTQSNCLCVNIYTHAEWCTTHESSRPFTFPLYTFTRPIFY